MSVNDKDRSALLSLIVTDGEIECPHCGRRGGEIEEIETVLRWNPGRLFVEGGVITRLEQLEDTNSDGQHDGYQCAGCKGALLLPEDLDVYYP